MLVSSLQRGVRQSLALAQCLERGVGEAEAARTAGVAGRPAAVQAATERARRRPVRAWRSMLEDVADLERRAKTGAGADANEFARLALRWRA